MTVSSGAVAPPSESVFSPQDKAKEESDSLAVAHERTPLAPLTGSGPLKVWSADGSESLSLRLWLKLDLFQKSGSFKLRGVGETVRQYKLSDSSYAGCICSSGGNAGLACALACRVYGMRCKIILPTTTPAFAVDKLKSMNPDVEVQIFGSVWNESNEEALKLVNGGGEHGEKWAYVHPFEGEHLIQGHSSIVDEVVEQLPDKGVNLAAIVTVCGGGGLARGIKRGIERHFGGRSECKLPLIAVGETEGADCFYESCHQRKPVVLEGITSIAKSLGSLRSDKLYEEVSSVSSTGVDVLSFRISDKQALEGVIRFRGESASYEGCDGQTLLVEPACGAALTFGYDTLKIGSAPGAPPPSELVDRVWADGGQKPTDLYSLLKGRVPGGVADVVIEVCGGKMIDAEMLEKWARDIVG